MYIYIDLPGTYYSIISQQIILGGNCVRNCVIHNTQNEDTGQRARMGFGIRMTGAGSCAASDRRCDLSKLYCLSHSFVP